VGPQAAILAALARHRVLSPRRVASPRGAGLGGWRRLAHGLAIVAGWVLFFWGWQRVLAATTDFSELRLLMIGAAIVVPVVTVSWILHNQGIHRRKGPRRHVPVATLAYRMDFNGREIVADFRALAEARRVDVVVDGALKTYRAQDGQAVPDTPEGTALPTAERPATTRAPIAPDVTAARPAPATRDATRETTASEESRPPAAP